MKKFFIVLFVTLFLAGCNAENPTILENNYASDADEGSLQQNSSIKLENISFDFAVNEWDADLNVTQITDKSLFADDEIKVFNQATEYTHTNAEIAFLVDKTDISCAYNRNSQSFVLTFEIQNSTLSTDEFVLSNNYKYLVSYGLQWLDYIDNLLVKSKELYITCLRPKSYDDEFFRETAFILLNDNIVRYPSKNKLVKKPLSVFIEDFNIDYEEQNGSVSTNTWDFIDFSPIPFSIDDFHNSVKETNWYDNGVFSAYIKMAYPNDTWEYVGSFSCNMSINPYGYTGFQIYSHQCASELQVYTYLVPISPSNPPEVYSFDETSETMKIVFRNGEILEQ